MPHFSAKHITLLGASAAAIYASVAFTSLARAQVQLQTYTPPYAPHPTLLPLRGMHTIPFQNGPHYPVMAYDTPVMTQPHPSVQQISGHTHTPQLQRPQAKHKTIAVNAESDLLRPPTSYSSFKISVDGQTIAGDGFDYESEQRANDVALAAMDIQVRFDGLDVTPKLNVGVLNDVTTIRRGQPVNFLAYSNYESFIAHGEIRIFQDGQSVESRPLAIIPVNAKGLAQLVNSFHLPEQVFYQLRVYDKGGRFDETHPKPLQISDMALPDVHFDPTLAPTIAGYGVDATLSRTIRVKGGTVTINGAHVPSYHSPVIFGHAIPVDSKGDFVTQQILPFGDQSIDINILNPSGQGVSFRRNIHIKETEFFYVALGDITLGQRGAIGPADLKVADDEDFEEVVVNGRGAFYLKGKVKGDYLITAAMDTGENRLKDIVSNLDQKNPRQLLRRLEADRFYPVYGDDSHAREDAPTQGRFFVRVDKDNSHVMWGNFATQVTGTEFAQLDRGLYGGIADYNSKTLTRSGKRKTEATIFAADPGTVPGRDEFRGTGGSVYFLKRQDISIGSERLRIEIRDKVTGLVIETQDLRPQEDYDIDYIQGRILLSSPLQSTVSDNQLVRDGGLSGNEAYLVSRYEYTPGLSSIEGYTLGGRATHWVGNHLRLGVTAQNEETDTADQELYGVDAMLKASNETYIKGEYARSNGPGFGQSNSTDGGFIFDDIATPGSANREAEAYRLETKIKLGLNRVVKKLDVFVTGLVEHVDEGFSGVGRLASGAIDRYSLGLRAKFANKTDISVKMDRVESSRRGDTQAIYADISHNFNNRFSGGVGLRHDERNTSAQAANLSPNRFRRDGKRTDASAELRYKSTQNWSLRGFIQTTLSKTLTRQSNSRAGLGGDIQLSSRLNASGDISDGDGGLGASAKLTYQRSENSELYLSNALSVNRSDTGFSAERIGLASNQGTVTLGTRTRYSDSLSVYGEEQFTYGGSQRQLTHTYGVDYSPNEIWTFGASLENGTISDDINGDFDRTAFSVSASRGYNGLRMATNLEGRFESGVLQGRERDRTTWLMRNTVAYDIGRDVEVLGRLNFAISDSDQSSFLNSDYVEGVLAAAYRPVENDRLNALAKYTYFEDLSPAQQVSNNNQRNLARQRSQILSLDATYDLNRYVSLGGKLGYRMGEVALGRGSDVFVKSDALLGVARADFHIVNKWDALFEGRVLRSDLAEDTRYGALTGIYRHVGDNFKIGAGYSFSAFSDDLTDFNNDSHGVFINIVGKI